MAEMWNAVNKRLDHLIIGDQVGQAVPAFHEHMLAGPDPLAALCMPWSPLRWSTP